MNEFLQVVAGSSATNIGFIILFGVLNYFRKRLNKSNCQSHCFIFDCEAQLTELQSVRNEITTQRGMLQNVLELVDSKSAQNSDTVGPQNV